MARKIGNGVPYLRCEANAIAIGLAEGVLQNGEEASGPWQGCRHGAQLAEELMPHLDRNSFACGSDEVQQFIETCQAVRW
jgi:hypothetical protein